MRLSWVWLAACLAAGFPAISHAGGTLDQAPQLEATVRSALEEFAVPGAAIGLWTPNGHWVMTIGLADVTFGRPVKRRDRFAIRSITKSFVVTIVMQLVAQSDGAIGLDDPIAKYLPGIPNGETITLRELANMTSGLYNYSQDQDFLQALQADLTRLWTTDELLAFAFDGRSHRQINFEPGTRYEYSNTNTLVLGKLVEALTGRPFTDVLDDQILVPLQLRSTAFLSGTELPPPAVLGYDGVNADGLPNDIVVSFSALGFAGAMASTLPDLAHWGRALANGSLLPAALQQQRFAAHPISADPASPVYDAYGMGMGEVAGWWGHTGDGVGFEAAVFHQVDRNETFAILLNESRPSDIPVRIFCRVLQVLNEGPPSDSGSVCAAGGDGTVPGATEAAATLQ